MRYIKMFVLSLLFILPLTQSLHAGEPKRVLTCRQCSMQITEENRKFAVIVPAGIEHSAFDDIGCAMLWRSGECAMRQAAFDENAVVRDHATGAEVPVLKAFFVIDSGVRTPMGFGVLAFASKEAAEAFVAAQKRGTVASYAGLENFMLDQKKEQRKSEDDHQGGKEHHEQHGSGQMHHPEHHPEHAPEQHK